jgi:hypothetical protein
VATKFSSRRHRRLGFQPLEERTMMAGDAGANILGGNVAVIVIAGDLYVTGDAAANNVAIAQVMQNGVPVNGNYVINGLNGTTINGGTGYRATGVTRDFIIDMGGGGDSLLLGPDPNFSTPTSNDKLNVPRDLNVWMGNSGTYASYFGSNTFYANGITVGHDADIRAGYAKEDHFYVRGKFKNDVAIDSVADAAYITMFNSSVSNDLDMSVEGQTLAFDQEFSLYNVNIGHDARIYSYVPSPGNSGTPGDLIYVDMQSVSVSNALSITTDEAYDQFSLQNVTSSSLDIHLGAGAGLYNRVDLKGVGVYGAATLITGDGGNANLNPNDRFDIQGTFVALTVNGGAGNDTVLIHDSMTGSLTIKESSLSNQHDVVSVKNTYVGGNASVTTGSGSDTVTLDNASVYSRLTINTGSGADYITLTNCVADELFAYLGGNNGDELDILGTSRFRRGTLDGGGGGSFLYIAKDVVFTEYYHHMNFYLSYWDK